MPTSPVRYCIQLLLIATASLTLTACGGGSSGGNTTPPASSSSSSSSSESQSSSESSSENSSSSESSSSSDSSDSSESSSSSSSESDSSSSEPPDTVPDAFSFAPQSDVPRGAQLTSQAVTINGLEAPATITITGGDYAIDGGGFTGEPGQIDNDQTLTLRLNAPESFATQASATVNVGGVEASFDVTTLARDTTPEAFEFAALEDQARGEEVTSEAATITGINDAAEVTIENGQYAIDGGAFTSEPGQIDNDQSLTLRLTTAEAFDTARTATVTVGGVEASFTATTLERDTTPEAFGFAPLDEQALAETVTSGEATITGINDAAEVTIENGQYAIDGGEFTAEPGEIEQDQTLTVQTTTSDTPGTTKEAVVTVGGVEGSFAVTTVEDTDPPEAAFVFPTPMTATEAPTVIVRGTAEDELTDVKQVTLTVENDGSTTDLALESDDGFATWQKEVPLTDGENTITLRAEDTEGNAIEESERESITVVKQAFTEAFPVGDDNPFSTPVDVLFDRERNRVFVVDKGHQLVAVALDTGRTSLIVREGGEVEMSTPGGIALDAKRNRVLVTTQQYIDDSESLPAVVGIDLETEEISIVTDGEDTSGGQPGFYRARGIAIHPRNPDRAFFLEAIPDRLFSLNLETGERAVVSANDAPEGEPELGNLGSRLLIDSQNNRAFVGMTGVEGVITVDLSSGERETFLAEDDPRIDGLLVTIGLATDDISKRILISEGYSEEIWSVDVKTKEISTLSGGGKPHSFNEIDGVTGITMSHDKEYLFAVDEDIPALLAIDIDTGERVVVSKPSH